MSSGNVLTTPKLICLPIGPEKLLRNSFHCQEGSRTDLAPCHASPGKAGVHLERRPGADARGRPRHALDVPQGPQPRQREVRGVLRHAQERLLRREELGRRDVRGVLAQAGRLHRVVQEREGQEGAGVEDDQAAQGGARLYCAARRPEKRPGSPTPAYACACKPYNTRQVRGLRRVRCLLGGRWQGGARNQFVPPSRTWRHSCQRRNSQSRSTV